MSNAESFSDILRVACKERGWELLPSGVNISLIGGRHQVINLETFEFRGREMIRFSTTIGDASDLDDARLNRALGANATLAHGALAIAGHDLVMTDTLLLKHADAREVESSLSFLGEQADHYEQILFGIDKH
jgi:hypothetical protein